MWSLAGRPHRHEGGGVDVIGKLLLCFGTREQIVLAYTIDVERDLGSITAPTLMIGASNDNFVDVAHSVHASKGIPERCYYSWKAVTDSCSSAAQQFTDFLENAEITA